MRARTEAAASQTGCTGAGAAWASEREPPNRAFEALPPPSLSPVRHPFPRCADCSAAHLCRSRCRSRSLRRHGTARLQHRPLCCRRSRRQPRLPRLRPMHPRCLAAPTPLRPRCVGRGAPRRRPAGGRICTAADRALHGSGFLASSGRPTSGAVRAGGSATAPPSALRLAASRLAAPDSLPQPTPGAALPVLPPPPAPPIRPPA